MKDAGSASSDSPLSLAVIIPVHNGATNLKLCLEALSVSRRKADEVIVVDDASNDRSGSVALNSHAHLISLPGLPHGPACARNRGAQATQSDILVFLDSDVLVHQDTLTLFDKYFRENPSLSAIFGSYDESPRSRGFVSQYKNLLHHYVHQHGQREALTFWAGCGGIRRKVFDQIGGFDECYPRPSIEDIELGTRLAKGGFPVWLCRDIQVTHLKNWTLKSLLLSDVRDRAIPWSQLILRQGVLPADLNLDAKSRTSAILAWGLLLFLVGGIFSNWLWIGGALSFFGLVLLNRELYIFFNRHGGFLFCSIAAGLHMLYLLYSSLIFISLFGIEKFKRLQFWETG